MRKSVALIGITAIFLPAAAMTQEVGHVPGGDGIQNADPYSNGSTNDQLLRERALNNLPAQQSVRSSTDKAEPARPAKAAELTLGARVNDKMGVAIATIQSVDRDGIVLSNGIAKVKVPPEAFGHNKSGLLLDLTKTEFEQVVAKANSAPNG
jgi:hypothetical protein